MCGPHENNEALLGVWLADCPRQVLPLLHETAQQFALQLYENYDEIHANNIFVRITGLPVTDSLRSIRQSHLDCLVRTSGVVTRRTGVFPQLQARNPSLQTLNHPPNPPSCPSLLPSAKTLTHPLPFHCPSDPLPFLLSLSSLRRSSSPHLFIACDVQMVVYDCSKCKYKNGPFVQNQTQEVKPLSCSNCQSKGPFEVNIQETVYRNYQKITLQESPGTVPAGRLPRSKEIVLLHDLIDIVSPSTLSTLILLPALPSPLCASRNTFWTRVRTGGPGGSIVITSN